MNFTCTKENLSQALNMVNSGGGKHANLPILMNVLIDANESGVKLITTNLESAIKTNLRARVATPGSFTVPVKTLADYVNLVTSEQIEITLEENELLVKGGNSSTKIKGAPSDEYPVIPDIDKEYSYQLLVEPFKESLSKVVFTASKSEIRPELSGVYFGFFTERYDGLILAATDSYRLAEKKNSVSSGGDELKCVVPVKAVYEMVRLLSIAKTDSAAGQVELWVGGGQISMSYGGCEIISRLIDGDYPDYTQIIPSEFKTNTTIPVDIFVNKLKSAALFSMVGVNAVSVDFRKESNIISISSASTQTGEHTSEIDVEIDGDENSILLNHKYVLDGLQHLGTKDFLFSLNSGDTPCLIKPKGKEDYLYIVMPIRQ